MHEKLKNFTTLLPKLFGNKKTLTIVTVIGLAGIILIGSSDWLFSSKSEPVKSDTENLSVHWYINTLEKKTAEMLVSIDGAGKSKIMITAEASAANQYAVNETISDDVQNDQNENRQKTEVQTEIVMIEGDNGGNQALVAQVIEPQIRGVLVLCEGADNPEIKEKVTQAVKTVLGVSSNKICVIKLKQ